MDDMEVRWKIHAGYGNCRIQYVAQPSYTCAQKILLVCEAYALGIAFRFGLHLHPESHSLYILEYLFVVLSPCGFIAAEYVLLGRLARWLKASQHVLIPPNRITLVFVLSDVSTFLIQVGDR